MFRQLDTFTFSCSLHTTHFEQCYFADIFDSSNNIAISFGCDRELLHILNYIAHCILHENDCLIHFLSNMSGQYQRVHPILRNHGADLYLFYWSPISQCICSCIPPPISFINKCISYWHSFMKCSKFFSVPSWYDILLKYLDILVLYSSDLLGLITHSVLLYIHGMLLWHAFLINSFRAYANE